MVYIFILQYTQHSQSKKHFVCVYRAQFYHYCFVSTAQSIHSLCSPRKMNAYNTCDLNGVLHSIAHNESWNRREAKQRKVKCYSQSEEKKKKFVIKISNFFYHFCAFLWKFMLIPVKWSYWIYFWWSVFIGIVNFKNG